jgi:hypothetical protein
LVCLIPASATPRDTPFIGDSCPSDLNEELAAIMIKPKYFAINYSIVTHLLYFTHIY